MSLSGACPRLKACKCLKHDAKPIRPLTELMLDCWQRETDRRPYENLFLHSKTYESKMFRHLSIDDFKVIIQFLKNRNNVKSLEIAYMNLPDILCFEFGNVLANLDKVSLIARMLRLSGNELTIEHAKHLRCFLIHAKSLQYLDVGFCDLDETTFAIVADGIHKSKTLKAVDMSRIVNRSPVSCVDESKVGIIVAILIWRCPLVEIHLKHCGLDQAAISPIVEYIARNRNLLYLDLGSNKIEGKGALMLLEAIRELNCMIGLDISNNRLGEYGGEVVAHYLPGTKLRYLDIGRNKIPANQMFLILSTIKKIYQTRILNIVGNDFDTKAATTLDRQFIAKTLLLESTDVSVTYDSATSEYRIVPRGNDFAKYNERYHRTAKPYSWPDSFFVQLDDARNFTWNACDRRKILVNGIFIGPVIVKRNGLIVNVLEDTDVSIVDCITDK